MKRDKRPSKIAIGQLVLKNVTDLRPEAAYPKAVTEVFGVYHHVYFIKVTNEDGMQEAVNDSHGYYQDMQCLNAGTLCTVEVPGYPGRYVMVLFPLAE
jgi:hypothetical protein